MFKKNPNLLLCTVNLKVLTLLFSCYSFAQVYNVTHTKTEAQGTWQENRASMDRGASFANSINGQQSPRGLRDFVHESGGVQVGEEVEKG